LFPTRWHRRAWSAAAAPETSNLGRKLESVVVFM